MILYCRRCGWPSAKCWHVNTDFTIDGARADRIRARYELGKRFDQANHDTNDYYSEPDTS